MKRIEKFAELCALPIGSFVQIKTKKCEDYVVIVCRSKTVNELNEKSSDGSYYFFDETKIPCGSLVIIYGLQERISFHARTANCHVKDRTVRGEFESEGYRYEFYRLEPEEICDLFLRMQSLSQGREDVIKCLKDNVVKLEKRLS
jgi:hypothetical protein